MPYIGPLTRTHEITHRHLWGTGRNLTPWKGTASGLGLLQEGLGLKASETDLFTEQFHAEFQPQKAPETPPPREGGARHKRRPRAKVVSAVT